MSTHDLIVPRVGERQNRANPRQRAQRAAKSSPLAAFQVEGERHLWWHVAIDRLTGEVLDEAVEVIDN